MDDIMYVWVITLMFTWSGHPTMGWPVRSYDGGPAPFITEAECKTALATWREHPGYHPRDPKRVGENGWTGDDFDKPGSDPHEYACTEVNADEIE